MKKINRRLIIVFSVIVLCATMLYGRLYYLAGTPKYTGVAEAQSTYTLNLPQVYANIYDRNYNKLVNVKKDYIAAIFPDESNYELLKKEFGENADSILEEKKPVLFKPKENISLDENIEVFEITKRYSDNQTAPHAIGYMIDGHGVTGLEAAFDSFLRTGENASITYSINARGGLIGGIDKAVSKEPVISKGIVTTLDCEIQAICEEASSLISKGAIIVMEPYTGEILAMVSAPMYSTTDIEAAVNDEENKPLLNRAFISYPLGSVFKLSVSIAALESGLSEYNVFTCKGYEDIDGVIIKCHYLPGHGDLDMRSALVESCNCYFMQLAASVNTKGLLNVISNMPFGKSASFAPGFRTQTGYLQTVTDLYNPAEKANFSFGQGKLLVTPVQIAQLTSAIVNDGRTPKAILVKGVTEDGITLSEELNTPAYTNSFSAETAEKLRSYMQSAVEDKDDVKAKPDYVTAAGKTATAQTGLYNDDGNEIYHGWYTGFVSGEAPKYVITVFSEEGGSGNLSAGPVFKYIADKLYELTEVGLVDD